MWYNFLSLFYDRALEGLYRSPRELVIEELDVSPGEWILDVACGTGQNFPLIRQGIGDGVIVGVDHSRGMLKKARHRSSDGGWSNVRLVESNIHDLSSALTSELGSEDAFDSMICTLGLSVIDDWESAFKEAAKLVKPGGRIVLFDAYIDKPVFKTYISRVFAQADLSRKFWEPLQLMSDDFSLVQLDGSPRVFGGHLYVASGLKKLDDQSS